MTAPRVGILALQGDVREHAAMFDRFGATVSLVRSAGDLAAIDALVLPGGESTTMSRLLGVFDMIGPLRARLADGMPAFATCAGAILLSAHVLDGRDDQEGLGTLDLTVRRNGYGRQVDSFEADIDIPMLATTGDSTFRAVFIRAPRFERVGNAAQVLATYDNNPVAIAQGGHMAFAFHPEMTADGRLHEQFLNNLRSGAHAAA